MDLILREFGGVFPTCVANIIASYALTEYCLSVVYLRTPIIICTFNGWQHNNRIYLDPAIILNNKSGINPDYVIDGHYIIRNPDKIHIPQKLSRLNLNDGVKYPWLYQPRFSIIWVTKTDGLYSVPDGICISIDFGFTKRQTRKYKFIVHKLSAKLIDHTRTFEFAKIRQ